jgi:hypothetical protein
VSPLDYLKAMRTLQRDSIPFKRMPKRYVETFFDTDKVVRRSENARNRTQAFLAKQLSVPKAHVSIHDGDVYLSDEAYDHMRETPVGDSTFLVTGGTARSFYEIVEMGYNDIMSGSVCAATKAKKGLFKGALDGTVELLGKPTKQALLKLAQSGALKLLGGIGIAATAGVGVWLGALGKEQLKQANARQDREQAWNGSRSLFLGAESVAASLAISGHMISGPIGAAAGALARAVAAPFACVHGVIDVAQGVDHLNDGVRAKDGLRVTEGLSEIGMGIGWLAAAFCPIPVVVGSAAVCLAVKLGVALLKSRRARKAKAQELFWHHKDELKFQIEFDQKGSSVVKKLGETRTMSSAELYPDFAGTTELEWSGHRSIMSSLKNGTLKLASVSKPSIRPS